MTFTLDQAYSDLYSVDLYSSARVPTTDRMDVWISTTANYSNGTMCARQISLIDASPARPLTVLCPNATGIKFVSLKGPQHCMQAASSLPGMYFGSGHTHSRWVCKVAGGTDLHGWCRISF